MLIILISYSHLYMHTPLPAYIFRTYSPFFFIPLTSLIPYIINLPDKNGINSFPNSLPLIITQSYLFFLNNYSITELYLSTKLIQIYSYLIIIYFFILYIFYITYILTPHSQLNILFLYFFNTFYLLSLPIHLLTHFLLKIYQPYFYYFFLFTSSFNYLAAFITFLVFLLSFPP